MVCPGASQANVSALRIPRVSSGFAAEAPGTGCEEGAVVIPLPEDSPMRAGSSAQRI